jgi:hypothetical protein
MCHVVGWLRNVQLLSWQLRQRTSLSCDDGNFHLLLFAATFAFLVWRAFFTFDVKELNEANKRLKDMTPGIVPPAIS